MAVQTKSVPKTAAYAVQAALLAGFVTHLFGLVNIMHNNDDIWQQPMGYGTGLSSGRWLLTILGDFQMRLGLGYNLSVVNGVLFLAMIAVTAGIVVSVFRIQNTVRAGIIGILFAVFPSVTSVLFFKYTTITYGIAILLSVLAVWVLKYRRFGLLLSALCTACGLGIYQAYVPITITMMVLLMIQQVLEGTSDFWQVVRRGLYYCAALILGLVVYFGLLKLCLAVYGTELSDYQGVNNMGVISLGTLPGLVLRAFKDFCKMPLYDYCGLANIALLRGLYLILAGVTAVLIGYILIVKIRKWEMALAAAVLCGLLPVAANFAVVMCPDALIYTLMVYSFVLIPCMPLILMECLPPMEGVWKKIHAWMGKGLAAAVLLMAFCYGYYANVNYTAMYFSNRQVENYWNSIVTQVRMTEGFEPDQQWALMGNIQDPMLGSAWADAVSYGGNRFTDDLLNQYSRLAWVSNYMGIQIPAASQERIEELSRTEQVRAMPCWPAQGSVRIVEDTVIIKFQELAEEVSE
ncbi:MAG: glucosyltransferase domain-containing protein [Oscillospiraceae bacterium]|nr:glucosyltransferase domain-containing protein [Oscillospiraceae bacterium]